MLLHAALGALGAVLLTCIVDVLGIKRRSGSLDLACTAVIVAATILGSEFGRGAGRFGFGLVLGAMTGAIIATALRQVAARA